MIQFYFLSVLLNLLSGLIFIYVLKGEGETNIVLSDSDDPFKQDDTSAATDDFDFNPDGANASTENTSSNSGDGLRSLAAPFLSDKTFQLVIGILSVLTGLMKLLSPIEYDVPIVGDLVPSLAGLISGAFLLLDWYQDHSGIELPLPEAIQNFYTGGRKYLGIFCVIAASLHFIFPRVLFL